MDLYSHNPPPLGYKNNLLVVTPEKQSSQRELDIATPETARAG